MSASILESISERAQKITLDLLPAKSREQYEKEYQVFKEWQAKNKVKEVNEDVMLTYVHEKSKELKPSSVWSKYSMLKTTLALKENVKVETFSKVLAFLKRNSVGYEPKKSKILSREEVNTFLKEADDERYLLIKVAVCFGNYGACRREELHSLRVPEIMENGDSLVITLSDTKTNRKRVFAVTSENESVNPLELYRKYANLRSRVVPHDYFFINYRNKKCTVQRVGIHSFGKMPSVVAEFLNLANPKMYTGHCFRRTSATLLADSGADIVTLKRLGGWRSSTVAETYIEDSIEKKKKVSRLVMGGTEMLPSTSTSSRETCIATTVLDSNTTEMTGGSVSFCGDSFKYASNCSFTFNISK